jgi:hypothetical protein
MRNYVISHSTKVFEMSYQSFRTRAQLMQLAFGAEAGNHNRLFSRLNDISLTRDPGAPVEIAEAQKREFEKRNDTCGLRCDIEAEVDKKSKSRLRNQLTNHLKILNQLQLRSNRFKYFQQVDLLRARGGDTLIP